MTKSNEETDLPLIDCTKQTEEISQAIDSEDDKAAQRELAELMGETVEEEPMELDLDEITTYELGYTYELKRPFTVARGNELVEISEVVFGHELEGRHVAKMPMDMSTWKWQHYLTLVGACTGLHSSVLMKIKTCDLPHIVGVASSFFANGPKNG